MRVNVTLDGSYIHYRQELGEPLRHNPFYVGILLDRVKRTFKRVLDSIIKIFYSFLYIKQGYALKPG